MLAKFATKIASLLILVILPGIHGVDPDFSPEDEGDIPLDPSIPPTLPRSNAFTPEQIRQFNGEGDFVSEIAAFLAANDNNLSPELVPQYNADRANEVYQSPHGSTVLPLFSREQIEQLNRGQVGGEHGGSTRSRSRLQHYPSSQQPLNPRHGAIGDEQNVGEMEEDNPGMVAYPSADQQPLDPSHDQDPYNLFREE